MFQRDQSSSLFLGGERTTGQDVRSSNGKADDELSLTRVPEI